MVTTVSKVDEGVLLSVPNPGYAGKINKYLHLKGMVMDDDNTDDSRLNLDWELVGTPAGGLKLTHSQRLEKLEN